MAGHHVVAVVVAYHIQMVLVLAQDQVIQFKLVTADAGANQVADIHVSQVY
jgi:hypothetical protein